MEYYSQHFNYKRLFDSFKHDFARNFSAFNKRNSLGRCKKNGANNFLRSLFYFNGSSRWYALLFFRFRIGYLPQGVKLYKKGVECENSLVGLDCGEHEYQIKAEYKKEIMAKTSAYFWSDFLLTQKEFNDESCVKFIIDGKTYSPIQDCISVEEKYGIENFKQRI